LAACQRRLAGQRGEIRLLGWSQKRRVVRPRRHLRQALLTERTADDTAAGKAPLQLGFIELDARREAWKYALLVTSLQGEPLTLAQLYGDRGDAENRFD
jgi:hypothetical protein